MRTFKIVDCTPFLLPEPSCKSSILTISTPELGRWLRVALKPELASKTRSQNRLSHCQPFIHLSSVSRNILKKGKILHLFGALGVLVYYFSNNFLFCEVLKDSNIYSQLHTLNFFFFFERAVNHSNKRDLPLGILCYGNISSGFVASPVFEGPLKVKLLSEASILWDKILRLPGNWG